MIGYDFKDLHKLVKKQFGVDPSNLTSSFSLPKITKKIKKTDFKNVISFEFDDEEGVFYRKNGNSYKGFLYIPIYNQRLAKKKGWNTMPRFHTTKCKTIEDQMNRSNFNGHYVFSNAPVTNMEDVDGIKKDLMRCKNCQPARNKYEMTTTQFYNEYIKVEKKPANFTKEEIPIEYEVDLWGYTPDWSITSKAYRFQQNFTCESCSIQLNGANGYFLDTHHINGNKTDNRQENLRCLCVLCHANVDEIHQHNFSVGRSRQRLVDFKAMFRNGGG